MVLFYTLNENFKQTTQGLNPAAIWAVRMIILGIAIAAVMLVGNLIMNGAPRVWGS